MLRLRKLPRYELDVVDPVDAIRVLVACMKVSAMVALPRLDKHANDDAVEPGDLRQGRLLQCDVPGPTQQSDSVGRTCLKFAAAARSSTPFADLHVVRYNATPCSRASLSNAADLPPVA